MARYQINTQAQYDEARKRLVDIGSNLCRSDISQACRDELFNEQINLAESLLECPSGMFVNNPIG